ncbi:hypothetical protein ACFLYH_02610 [Candidatus Dependentiae bacterium]
MNFKKMFLNIKFFTIFCFLTFNIVYCITKNNIDIKNAWKESELFNYSDYLENNDIKRTAIHESGHAIVGYLLNIKITGIHINIDNSYCDLLKNIFCDCNAGYITFFCNGYTNYKKMIKLYLAGYVAEEIMLGKANIGIYEDLEKVTSLIIENNKNIDKQKLFDILKKNIAETRKIINQNIDLFNLLANKLFQKKHLNAEQFKGLIAGFSNSSKNFSKLSA